MTTLKGSAGTVGVIVCMVAALLAASSPANILNQRAASELIGGTNTCLKTKLMAKCEDCIDKVRCTTTGNHWDCVSNPTNPCTTCDRTTPVECGTLKFRYEDDNCMFAVENLGPCNDRYKNFGSQGVCEVTCF